MSIDSENVTNQQKHNIQSITIGLNVRLEHLIILEKIK